MQRNDYQFSIAARRNAPRRAATQSNDYQFSSATLRTASLRSATQHTATT
jgi:hypothetical protein